MWVVVKKLVYCSTGLEKESVFWGGAGSMWSGSGRWGGDDQCGRQSGGPGDLPSAGRDVWDGSEDLTTTH